MGGVASQAPEVTAMSHEEQAKVTPPGAASPSKRKSRGIWVAVVLAVAIAIILVISLAVLILPRSSPSGPGASVDFVTARQRANASLDAYGVGPWTLISVWGFNNLTATTIPNTYRTLFLQFQRPDCNQTVVGLGANITVPASPSAVGNGSAAFWELVYRNATAGAIVDVVNGAATVGVALTGAQCGASLAAFPAVPETATSSGSVAAALDVYDVAFSDEFPHTLGVLGITTDQIAGYTYPIWVVEYSACPAAHVTFVAELNVSSNYVLSADTTVGSCAALSLVGPQLEADLGLAPAWEAANGSAGAEYVWNVTAVSHNATWADLLPLATEHVGTFPTPPGNVTQAWIAVTTGWNVTARTESNVTVATYDPSSWSWSGNEDSLIQENDSIEVVITGPQVDNPYFSLFLGGAETFYGEIPLGPSLL